ncbi:MAG: septal ring lytic transglycosylase RlpA family protein [Desulfobacterales bacterium]|nr:septal ring lytic transglycosylase RlpA family protein [Desulfobacterales bacterium]
MIVTTLLLILCISPYSECSDKKKDAQTGIASFYSNKLHGRRTASGELYDKNKFTAAHRSYPFGTMVRVTRPDNGKSVTVRINDRGPYRKGWVIDLSACAARKIDLLKLGKAKVRIEVTGQQE